jgi:hypothetical protein
LVGLYAKGEQDEGPVFATGGPQRRRSRLKVMDTYLEPHRSFFELHEMVIKGTIDLLHDFSDACHDEFEAMKRF